jgi:flagellar assembly factor FliW
MKAMATLEPNVRPPVQGKDTIIHFDEGLIGFSDCKDFQLMESDNIAPFRLLQSSQSKEVGFLVLEPSSIMKDYYSRIPAREWESIGLMPGDPHLAFVICIIGTTPKDSTGNFQAPLIINYKTMIGRQLILTDEALSVRQPLV